MQEDVSIEAQYLQILEMIGKMLMWGMYGSVCRWWRKLLLYALHSRFKVSWNRCGPTCRLPGLRHINGILYSGYISRAFYFGGFGELTEFAKIRPLQIKALYSNCWDWFSELLKGRGMVDRVRNKLWCHSTEAHLMFEWCLIRISNH